MTVARKEGHFELEAHVGKRAPVTGAFLAGEALVTVSVALGMLRWNASRLVASLTSLICPNSLCLFIPQVIRLSSSLSLSAAFLTFWFDPTDFMRLLQASANP